MAECLVNEVTPSEDLPAPPPASRLGQPPACASPRISGKVWGLFSGHTQVTQARTWALVASRLQLAAHQATGQRA